jgi:formate dehydrogenase subunit delta
VDIRQLITQANQIGDFFGAWPDREQARKEIANHLSRFWEPRMRRQLGDYVRTQGGEDLAPIVIEAIRTITPVGDPVS